MAASRRAVGRHQLRTWLKWSIRSGLLEKLSPEDTTRLPPGPTRICAQWLLAALSDPEPTHHPLKEILDEAQRFQDWADYCRKMNRRLILTDGRTDGAEVAAMERDHATTADWNHASRREPLDRPRTRLHPLWDEQLDGPGNRG